MRAKRGWYRSPDEGASVVITQPSDQLRYTFNDGRRGVGRGARQPVACAGERLVNAPDGTGAWTRVPLKLSPTQFESHGQTLNGLLIEPDVSGAASPLVVMVHGSERTSPSKSAYPYILASFGLRVFAYDKRGTGASEGEYTQNFELLADDAAAALTHARTLAAGRFTRAGYFGGSQGGWVAPLAATHSQADFVAVGFGLMLTPVEEDREQVLTEMREQGATESDLIAAREVADATAAVVRSHFEQGYDALARVKQLYGKRPWFARIKGEYTGDMLAMSEADLRRIGRARFDNLEVIWDYDAAATLAKLRVPQLWIIAEADREAPPGVTLTRLDTLRRQGSKIDIFSFPATDHGMIEFTEAADGTRTYGRITDGYFHLLADWIAGRKSSEAYGRARRR